MMSPNSPERHAERGGSRHHEAGKLHPLHDTVVGQEADKGMRRGELVSDRLLAGLILQRLDSEDCARGFILDGYPRTVDQATLLDGILAELGRSIAI